MLYETLYCIAINYCLHGYWKLFAICRVVMLMVTVMTRYFCEQKIKHLFRFLIVFVSLLSISLLLQLVVCV